MERPADRAPQATCWPLLPAVAWIVLAKVRCPVQSEWLIVAGCAGLLVNTVLLRYLLRVLGERRVLCIGMPSFL